MWGRGVVGMWRVWGRDMCGGVAYVGGVACVGIWHVGGRGVCGDMAGVGGVTSSLQKLS